MTKVSKSRGASGAAPPAPSRQAGRGRQQQKLDTRERVRESALALFVEQGFEKTTTKQVAERAGVATGTVFVHARDKDDLLFLVMERKLEDVMEVGFATVPKRGSLVQQIVHVYRGFFAMYAEAPALGVAFIRALPGATGPNGQRVNALTFAFLHRISALAKNAQEKGELLAHADLTLFAQCTFALYVFALTSWVTGALPTDLLEAWFKTALTQHLTGLAPRRG